MNIQSYTIRITPKKEENQLLEEEIDFLESLSQDHWDVDNGSYCFDNYFSIDEKGAVHTFRNEHPFLTTSGFEYQAFIN
jgi:hypothetical protein